MSIKEETLDLKCFEREYRFHFAGAHLESMETNAETHAWILTSAPRFLETFYINQREDGSLRVLFVQFSAGMKMDSGNLEEYKPQLLQKIKDSLAKHFRVTELLLDLSNYVRELGCLCRATCLLLRDGSGEEPLTDEDRKVAGLAGIPLDKLVGMEDSSQLLTRIFCGGLPPVMLVHAGEITFPARSWYPAGLIPDWQPWKQNVEYQPGDRLVLHMDLPGTQSSLKEFHERLKLGGSLKEAPVATVEISTVD